MKNPKIHIGIFFAMLPWVGVSSQEINLLQPEPTEPTEIFLPKEVIPDSRIESNTGKRLVFQDTVKLLFAGDTMFNWGVEDSILKNGYNLPFEDWVPIFHSVDAGFINLETTILREKRKPLDRKAFVFSGKEKDVKVLKKLNVSAVFLGNNHAMDYGTPGLVDTMDVLRDNKIGFLGAGMNHDTAYQPFQFTKKNQKFRIFSASDVAERNFPFAKKNSPGVAYYKESTIRSEFKKRKQPPGDHSILSLHWGHEYGLEPTTAQRKSAKRMLDLGFDTVIGHHPHIPQGIEIYKGKPIVYSLGNFIFGSKNHYLNHNIVIVLHYTDTGLGVVEVIPSFGKFQKWKHIFLPLGPNEGDDFLKEYALLCKKLGTDLYIRAGRGYVFLDKTMMRSE